MVWNFTCIITTTTTILNWQLFCTNLQLIYKAYRIILTSCLYAHFFPDEDGSDGGYDESKFDYLDKFPTHVSHDSVLILSVSHDSVLPTAQHRRYLSMFFVLDHHWVLNVSCPIGVIFQSFTQAWKTAVGLHRLQSEQALHVCQGTLTDTPLRKYVISPF